MKDCRIDTVAGRTGLLCTTRIVAGTAVVDVDRRIDTDTAAVGGSTDAD